LFRNAKLPPFLEEVRVIDLRVGEATVDLLLQRHEEDVGIQVTRRSGELEVLAVR